MSECKTYIPTPLIEDLCNGEVKDARCVQDENAYIDLGLPSNSNQGDINQAVYNALQASKTTTDELQLQIDDVSSARPYKVYTALLTQTGTNAPVATVLENTLGGVVVWSYDAVGSYIGTLVGAFTIGKTIFLLGNEITFNTVALTIASLNITGSEDSIYYNVRTFLANTTTGVITQTPIDDPQTAQTIEIRVYN